MVVVEAVSEVLDSNRVLAGMITHEDFFAHCCFHKLVSSAWKVNFSNNYMQISVTG
jgi:hypothetical protein